MAVPPNLITHTTRLNNTAKQTYRVRPSSLTAYRLTAEVFASRYSLYSGTKKLRYEYKKMLQLSTKLATNMRFYTHILTQTAMFLAIFFIDRTAVLNKIPLVSHRY